MEKNYEAKVDGKWIRVSSEDLLFRRVKFTDYREAFVRKDAAKQTAMEWIRSTAEVAR